MPDLKISELPAATAVADGDLTPFVQTSPTAKFKHFLPSANIAVNLREDLVLRFARGPTLPRSKRRSVESVLV